MLVSYALYAFFLTALVILPVLIALLLRWLSPSRWWRKMALACTLIIWGVVGYGVFVGYEQFEVHHVEYASADLPEAFDGYRIVQFSDAHVGTMTGSRQQLLQRVVDSINVQKADMIVFTGDMQNIYPDELVPHVATLRQLKAKDGVYAVLGNHDYATYQNVHPVHKDKNCRKTIQALRDMHFDLLLNEHRIIRRDNDSIVIAGMENWGRVKRMPRKGDLQKTLACLGENPFIVLLQHDPTAWRKKILPECNAQLTLSGHTHGGQAQLFGWSPVALTYDEWGGMYSEGDRSLYVSTGLGALIPFRLNQPGEIVVITLRKLKN